MSDNIGAISTDDNASTSHAQTRRELRPPPPAEGVWLESSAENFPIVGTCTIGRSSGNNVVVDSPRISRRHVVINAQNGGEFWLIDLGSSNGTYLNGRRIHQPARLTDQDQITIGDRNFIFHQPEETVPFANTMAAQTLQQIDDVPCWLLVADVEDFTPMSRSVTMDRLAVLMGGWFGSCKEAIERAGGVMNKYLGDGFLAYWHSLPGVGAAIATAVRELGELQSRQEPRFRVALHFGFVAIGGLPSMGEESLSGKEVNFVFRMEKLAGALAAPTIISASAKAKLGTELPTVTLGRHELKGFDGGFDFFGVPVAAQ